MSEPHQFICAECRETCVSERDQAEAHAEAQDNFGVRGDAPGMVEVCDVCYEEIMRRVRS